MKAQENDRTKEKKMDNNEIKLGDVVVWNFVFDVAEEKGVVVGLDGDRVQVQYDGYNGKVYQEWLSVDEILLESVYDSQVF
jgi:methyl coenzyme M reductase subunit C-like uncharacterized protein (methanogenesis marker protein 7)